MTIFNNCNSTDLNWSANVVFHVSFFDTILIPVITTDTLSRSQGLFIALSVWPGLGEFRSKAVGQSFYETVLGDFHRIEIVQVIKK